MAEARRRCDHLLSVRPRFDVYRRVSAQVFDVFREFTPLIEGLSLDEAFLDVSGSRKLFGDGRAIGVRIKAHIREVTGLTASVGIASNKLVAKIASDLDKPDGLVVVTPENLRATLDPLPVARLYFALDEGLDLSWLRSRLQRAPIRSRWDRMALSGLEDELAMALRALTTAAWDAGIRAATPQEASAQVDDWLKANFSGLERYRELMAEIEGSTEPDLAMLTVVVNSAGKLLRNVVLAAA